MNLTFDQELASLIDGWCERRQLPLLAIILPAYPRVSGLTDEWAELSAALKTIRVRYARLLTPEEAEQVARLQILAESIVHR